MGILVNHDFSAVQLLTGFENKQKFDFHDFSKRFNQLL